MSTPLELRELTACGPGAISVLELSGSGALERVLRLTPSRALVPGQFTRVELRDGQGQLLDEAIVLTHSPARVELHLHGSQAIVRRIAAELGAGPPAVLQASLERQAEACLSTAASEAAGRMLLDQVQGALRSDLTALLSRSGSDYNAGARLLARRGRVAQWLLCPPRVVLAGPVNAGKSTLFNLLVGHERVVVDAGEGTTRDAVSSRVQLGAYAVEFIDTAGERALSDGEEGAIERASQARAVQLRSQADLVLWLVPPGVEAPLRAGARTRIVRSRADLETPGTASRQWPALSALRAPGHARRVVEEVVHEALGLAVDPWSPGAGVPFDPAWIRGLEHPDPEVSRHLVREWLGTPPAD